MDPTVWALLRVWIRCRRGRHPRGPLADPISPGSNMNERLFRERRQMVWLEAWIGRLDDHRLVFTIGGGMRPGTSAPANIVYAAGESVYGVLNLLPLCKFACGWMPAKARNTTISGPISNGQSVSAVTYQVRQAAPEGRPGKQYLNLIREAARQRELPTDYVDFLDRARLASARRHDLPEHWIRSLEAVTHAERAADRL